MVTEKKTITRSLVFVIVVGALLKDPRKITFKTKLGGGFGNIESRIKEAMGNNPILSLDAQMIVGELVFLVTK